MMVLKIWTISAMMFNAAAKNLGRQRDEFQ